MDNELKELRQTEVEMRRITDIFILVASAVYLAIILAFLKNFLLIMPSGESKFFMCLTIISLVVSIGVNIYSQEFSKRRFREIQSALIEKNLENLNIDEMNKCINNFNLTYFWAFILSLIFMAIFLFSVIV